MRKLSILLSALTVTVLISCGPSAQDEWMAFERKLDLLGGYPPELASAAVTRFERNFSGDISREFDICFRSSRRYGDPGGVLYMSDGELKALNEILELRLKSRSEERKALKALGLTDSEIITVLGCILDGLLSSGS